MTALGIDTSNYTTSAAVYDGKDRFHVRRVLDVKEGMRGIRQSDGVFAHNKALPDMIAECITRAGRNIGAVGVSTRPRNAEGSYMPVFTVGHGYAVAVAAALDAELYEFSHQDGHIMAGIYSAGAWELLNKPFISVHLSGGTTEILRSEYNGHGFDNEIIGGTLDISVGQLIDRIGVAMGMKFPCGAELERLAETADRSEKLPFSVNGAYMNLSGVETKLIRLVNGRDARLARTVLAYIRDVLIKIIEEAAKITGLNDVITVGGVASNGMIRDGLNGMDGLNVRFASRELSCDNAVGAAVLAYLKRGK
ncbi:MAG: hypothetical protein IJH94_06455 [Clostridia bacterium]|nr:hypothetical protein [Clostridia bacterium]